MVEPPEHLCGSTIFFKQLTPPLREDDFTNLCGSTNFFKQLTPVY